MPSSRLFEILYILLERGSATADYLAQRLEISRRTVYRDIDALCAAGIPLITEQGRGGGIRLSEGFALDKAALSLEERREIIAALLAVSATGYQPSGDVAEKLAGVFGGSTRELEAWISVDFSGWSGNRSDLFELIKQAVVHKRALEFDYVNSCGQQSRRIVEPLQLCFKSRAWYMIAYCRTHCDQRIYKLSRMSSLLLRDERFDRKLESMPELPALPFSEAEVPLTVMHLDRELAYRVYDEFEPADYTTLPDGSFEVRLHCPIDEWLISYALSFGTGARVISPDHLRRGIIARLNAMLTCYSE